MSEYLYTTFGSKEVLQKLQAENPTHKLLLTVDDNNPYHYQLMEKTPEASIFKAPTSYQILSQNGHTEEIRGWMNFTFLTLPDQELANFKRRWDTYQEIGFGDTAGFISSFLLQRVDEPQQITILTTWTVKEYWTLWHDTVQTPLSIYEVTPDYYNIRDSQYSLAAFTKSMRS